MHARRWAALGLASWLALGVVPPASADVSLEQSGVTDVTGVAWDASGDRLFVAGRSGAVVALERDGRLISKLPFTADTTSVQGIAVRDEYLYIGDIGDEQAARSFVTVYRMPAYATEASYRAWDFTYPDGPQDAKALLISGKGRFYIITDGDNPGVYRSGDNPSRESRNELIRVMDAPAGVTDATFLADGTTMLLRTGTGVQVVDALSFTTTATLTYEGAPAGESITQLDGSSMLVGGAGPLREEPLPTGDETRAVGTTPAPSETPPPSEPEPTPAPSETAAETEPTPTAPVNRSGTLLALLGALALALLAGTITFVVRD